MELAVCTECGFMTNQAFDPRDIDYRMPYEESQANSPTFLAFAEETIMGLIANYPIALAPGMGLNAFFTYTVVGEMGYSWEIALGAVFISGVLFMIIIGGLGSIFGSFAGAAFLVLGLIMVFAPTAVIDHAPFPPSKKKIE